MISDFKKLPDQLIVDLVNETNTSTIPYTAVTVSQSSSAAADGKDRDSKVTLSSVPGGGYSGNKVVYFNRKPITDLLPEDIEFTVDTLPTTAEEARVALNEVSSAAWIITPDDPVEVTLVLDDSTAATERRVTFTITYADTAKVYVGTTSVLLALPDLELSSVITNDVLTGFTNP